VHLLFGQRGGPDCVGFAPSVYGVQASYTAVCTIPRARAVIGGAILVARTASSSASFHRSTTLAPAGAADATSGRSPEATHSSPALASDLRKVQRLSRDSAGVEACRSLLFTVALSLLIAAPSSQESEKTLPHRRVRSCGLCICSR
jgi:hypothetical protein